MPSHHEYRFEDSPGLKHSCGICGTPLHHPRAKKTCFGRHTEPCYNFHHTMFRIGRGSSCDACKKSKEQHLKRHKDIASLARQINIKNKNGDSLPPPAEVAMAVHGYRELSLDDKRETLDKALLKDVQNREKLSANPDKLPKADVRNEEIKRVVTKLGVNASRSQARDVRGLYTKLAEAIAKDIDTTANESRETRKRQLGYYRYADKRAYNAIMEAVNPAAVIVISDEENDAQEEEQEQEEEATPVVEQPQEQAAANRPPPRARPTPAAINTGCPERTVREGNMTFTFVPNTPVGTRPPNPPAGAARRDDRNNRPNV